MLQITRQVDKKVNDLSKEELNGLKWDSVPRAEFLTLKESVWKKCPYNYIIKYYNSDNFSKDIVIHVIYKAIRENLGGYNGNYDIYKVFNNFLSDKFIKDNKEEIISIFKIFEMKKYAYNFLSSSFEDLMERGHLSFFDTNISFETLVQSYAVLTGSIPQNDWVKLLKETNFMYVMLRDYSLEFNPIPLSTEQLRECGLPFEPVIDLSWIHNDLEDSDEQVICNLKEWDLKEIHWDSVVQKYYNKEISVEVLVDIWEKHILKYNLDELDETPFYKEGLSEKCTLW